MTYEQYMKHIFKGPLAITSYILVSVIVFMQFIALFLGRWVDGVEFASMTLIVIIMWILFAQAVAPNKKIKSATILSGTYAWIIVKLVSCALAIAGILSAGIYMIAKSFSDFGTNAGLMAAGILLLLFGTTIYVFRLVVCIMAIKEVNAIRQNKMKPYIPHKKWEVIGIILASLRGVSMILQYVVSALAYESLAVLGWYSSFFAKILRHTVNIGNNICITVIDLCYVAFFIMFIIIVKQYRKTLVR